MDVDSAVIQRHRRCAPLYDTYPGAEWFVEAFDATALDAALSAATAIGSPRMAIDLRLPAAGLHWPTRALADLPTLLRREIDGYTQRLPRRPIIDELRLSWSDAVGLDPDAVMRSLAFGVDIDPGAHLSVAMDVDVSQVPPHHTLRTLHALRTRGFDRVEMGTDAHVPRWRAAQIRTREAVEQAHEAGFASIGARFTYGASDQSLRDMRAGLADLLASAPTHVVLCNATDSSRHFRPVLDRSRSDKSTIETIRLLLAAVDMLNAAGYDCIGQDLYARASDVLATAHRQGRLLKKPHGLSIRPVSIVLAIGPGAVGSTGNAYHQNHTGASDYRAALERGQLPVMRGAFLAAADLARRAVIHALIADMFVDIDAIEATHRIDFRRCFADELALLAELEQAGLLLFDDAMIELTLAGRLIAGSVAMIFDRPLTEARTRMPFQGRL